MKYTVYGIHFEQPDKIYIGMAYRYGLRQRNHIWMMKNGKHSNELVQMLYNNYGIPTFIIFDEVDTRDEAIALEKEYIRECGDSSLNLNNFKG
jgi:predicted GIY-YIG superfamily endonuclease